MDQSFLFGPAGKGRDARNRGYEPGIAREIVEADKRDIMNSDGLIVYYALPSVGTSMEILFAWEQHKPIIVVNATMHPENELSLWLRHHATRIVPDINTAIKVMSMLLR